MKIIIILIIVYLLCISEKKALHQVAILLLCFLFANRATSVPDTLNYIEIYEQNLTIIDNIEIGYLYLCAFFHSLGLSFSQYLFCILFICLEILYKHTSTILRNRHIGIALVMLMSYFGLYYYGIVLRSAIAITICFCGIANVLFKQTPTSKLILLILIILASTIHISSLLFLLAFISFINLPKSILWAIIIATVLLLTTTSIIPISQFIEYVTVGLNANRLTRYASMLETSDGASILSWTYIFISAVALRKKNNIRNDFDKNVCNCFLNLYIFGSLINSLFWQIPGGSRLSAQFLFFEFIVVYYLIFKMDLVRRYGNQLMIGVLYVTIKTFALFHYYPFFFFY